MTFPTTIRADLGSGYPGDIALSGNVVATPIVISTGPGTVDDLVIGRVFSIFRNSATQPWIAAPGLVDPALYAQPGILITRGEYVNRTALESSLLLSENDIAELLHQCEGVWVSVATPASVRIGNYVIFNTTTGEVDTLAPADVLPTDWAVLAGATVIRDRASTNGLAMISLRGPHPVGEIPALAP